MGYFLTTEAENGVSAQSLATLKTHTPDPRMQERGATSHFCLLTPNPFGNI
jgi:hypothetical protein